MNAMMAYQIAGDRAAVNRVSGRVIGLADRFNLPPQKSIGTFMSAWVRAVDGDVSGGLQVMEQEFPRVSVMGPLPALYAGLLGSIRLANGDAARALELLGP